MMTDMTFPVLHVAEWWWDQNNIETIVLGILVAIIATILNNVLRNRRNHTSRHPPHLPSWIPYLGSSMELRQRLLRDFVLENAKRIPHHRGVFTATIAGQKSLFIVDPKYMNIVFKEIQEVDTMSLHKQFTKNVIGISDQEALGANIFSPEISKVAMDMFNRHLLSTDTLQDLTLKTQEVMRSHIKKLLDNDEENTVVPLYDFVSKIIFFASVGTLISRHMMTEEVMDDFFKIEAAIPLFMAEVPSFLVKDATMARNRLVDRMLEKEYHEQGSSFVLERRDNLAYLTMTMLAKNDVGLMIASSSNSIASTFWTLYHILKSEGAYRACTESIEQYKDKSDQGWTIQELTEMKILESCFLESLRLYQSVFIVRDVVKDFVLNPKDASDEQIVVPRGTRIMALPNTMHMNPDLYDDPESFRYDRFMDPVQIKRSTFRPFGGGVHLCPGRKFIEYEAKAFLTYMLLHYEMELVNKDDDAPPVDYSRQGIAVARPRADIMIQIRKRS